MVPHWKRWCRLCAREDAANTHIDVFSQIKSDSPFFDVIGRYFSINMDDHDEFPNTICIKCNHFITTLVNFIHRTSKVQAMFAELFENLGGLDAEQLKMQYELHELGDVEMDLKLFSNIPASQNFETKDNDKEAEVAEQMIDLEELEYIDEEMLASTNIKTEDVEDDAVGVFEDDWHPEMPSSSQHEDEDSDDKCDVIGCVEEEEEDDEDEEKPTVKKRGRPRLKPEVFLCPVCQEQFSSYTNYDNHMQTEHGISVKSLQYTCTKCNKAFPTERRLQNHLNTHLPLDQKLRSSCPFCEKKFAKSNAVQTHIRAVHMGEKPFVCEECGKAFKTFGALKEHKLTHTEETPFKCRYCEKCFKNKSRLKTHEDTHNETTYICTTCGLQLNTRRTLKMHMVVHSDQKRHKCDFCGNEYKRAKALKNHLILHTGLKPYTCNFCDKTFANGSNCRSHKKKNHPIELAAMEAAGTKTINSNIPKLEQLRAVTSSKVLQQPVMDYNQDFCETISVVSMPDDIESLKNEHLTMLRRAKEDHIDQQQHLEHTHIEQIAMLDIEKEAFEQLASS